MNATVVRDRRQTTLPADVCEAAGIRVNDQVEWRFEAGEIRGRKLQPQVLAAVIEIGREDVEPNHLLPRGWKMSGEECAAAIRDERDS
jgi:bifunctional DNA-binding transcriptional regulator/antitoxin component of YhaV-PrlF toxin-antitoxin module